MPCCVRCRRCRANGEAADRAALGTAGMLLGAMDSPFAAQLLAAQLGPLLDYDEPPGNTAGPDRLDLS